nr:phage tail sheath subtilisin-like domain-containing protein [Pedobacter sp. ASV19]
MSDFLHGSETINVDVAGRTYNIVKSGVIGLVGIAPLGDKNKPILVLGTKDFDQFGKQVPGFTIPQALNVIAAQKATTVIVVNVFDPTLHTTAVTAESQTVTNGVLKLAFAPIGTVTVLDSAGAPTTYVKDVDYTLDEFGNFAVIGSAIANAVVLKFTYKKLNISAVTASVINGTNTSGVRTGATCFELCFNLFGFDPGIFITPFFSTLSGVATNFRTLADKYRGIYYQDAPAGTVVSGALAGRGPTGTINFNTSHERTELVFPMLKKYDPATNQNVDFPYSAFLAGIRQAVDNDATNGGFWVSSSNREIVCQGVEIEISASISDSSADTSVLNGAGITTVLNLYGTGIRTWGNRNASFPSAAGPRTFSNITRIDDIVSKSMELAALPYIDKGITQAFIDVVREEGNSFIRTLIKRGAILPGSKVLYDPADNTPEGLADGHIFFRKIYMGSTPAERITFLSIMDISLLNNLK